MNAKATTFKSPRDALSAALVLAITAPDDAKADLATALAEQMIRDMRMTDADVFAAKRTALRRVRSMGGAR